MKSLLPIGITRCLNARLSRRIAFWVATSIVVIELIILVPSVYRRRQELLSQLQRLTSQKIAWIVETYPHKTPEDFLKQLQNLHYMNSDLMGGSLYSSDGQLIGSFGETPTLSFAEARDVQILYVNTPKGDRYDLTCDTFPRLDDYLIILRYDASHIHREVWYFIVRIAGLVLIISVFVTGATMVVLNYLVILPILNLRQDLIKAGSAITNHQLPPQFYAASVQSRDELGDVISAFMDMYNQISEAIAQQKQAEEALRQEKEKSEELLLNILPETIAYQLKNTHTCIANRFEQATILFADITNFTELASQLTPTELVDLLNQLFSAFDRLTDKYGLEKIKTIGDAYMVVGGIPNPRDDHPQAVADMALEMQQVVQQFHCVRLPVSEASGLGEGSTDDHKQGEISHQLNIRIGINMGPVVAGVIGLKKFTYDLWGDAVNTASRMESQGEPGKIQVSQTVYWHLKPQYILEKRGVVSVKGKGNMTTYWLISKRSKSVD
ncbi:MAG: adenylate/guanylate cyclase domain-containing protein [Limnospira sp. PMC 1291.21]|uniref:adenylate/guanylate cyclase domain-containing protein n=1 Tax=unclassified Limnospira TaxID=2642885 RepID=UPI0028E172D3|nr:MULTISPECIES: adenylate/guanylate cyclase domain-containing protein [unclassified Limnospira]MDT9177844.1 adenylate/guanylate cyclase domain-containing protein [Limnospira sp. PMC 1238.20]MDT9193949.1 adenylate/guanylate cyclase domain-containing protein [Limnospira sp. PMC 1245.20]MDT9204137.1 adenylate/guanylate cyclase domain-containing protein [Limnospira sp. PMC 1243.20]MDT9209295.1 adenylate/guanylate cyclase domain-containing protein [Limnospira sp. PMC 1252.20]MDT9214188.1 adenylate